MICGRCLRAQRRLRTDWAAAFRTASAVWDRAGKLFIVALKLNLLRKPLRAGAQVAPHSVPRNLRDVTCEPKL